MKNVFLILFSFTLTCGTISAQEVEKVPHRSHIYKMGERVQWIENGTTYTGTLVGKNKCVCDWKVIKDSDPTHTPISIDYHSLRPRQNSM